MSSGIVEIPQELLDEFKKFKLAKDNDNAALILKIDVINQPPKVVVEEIKKGVQLEELAEDLTESQPRYIIYNYKYTRPDGRVSYPLVFIFYCPQELQPRIAMLYSSTKTPISHKFEIMKTWDVQDPDILSEAWLKEKLAFYK